MSLRLRDTSARPRLVTLPASELIEFTVSESGYESEIELTAEMHVTAQIGVRMLGDWDFEIIPDEPPVIEFTEDMSSDDRQAVVFRYEIADDYGVANVEARIVPEANAQAEPLIVALAPAGNSRGATHSATRDLTAHGYAGAQVLITLMATDAAGQTGESVTVSYKLPERIFTHPLARAPPRPSD